MANLYRRNNETYLGFHVQCPIFLSDLKNKLEFIDRFS